MREVNQGPVTVGTKVYSLPALSVAADGGWREEDQVHVEALKLDFKARKYGAANFAKPSVEIATTTKEGVHEERVSELDGLVALDNGKSTIKVLKELKVVLNFMRCPG